MPNRLYYGDNLEVLRKRLKDDTVDLCYIDPPFNSKRTYNQIYNNIGSDDLAQAQAFIDTWKWDDEARLGYQEIIGNEGGRYPVHTIELIKGLRSVLKEGNLLAYLVSITRRVVEIRRVLKPTGSFFLHCDSTSSHYLKLVLDGIFCGQGGEFQNEIIWKRSHAHSDGRQGSQHFGRVTDTIFFYTKSLEHTWNRQYVPYEKEYVDRDYRRIDEDGRRYRIDNLQGPGGAAKGNPFYEVMGVKRYWRYSQEKMAELIRKGRVIQTKPGAVPQYKRYLDEMPGTPVQSLWADLPVLNNRSKEALGYPTQKPENLLERIIRGCSREGDLILDAYCGCGTTIAVAQRMKRNWVGIDITYQSIALVLRRLEDHFGQAVASSVALDGVPRDMASAEALARRKDDRTRKEFEKWAVLTYSRNRAAINEKKGADGGIDGYAYVFTSKTDTDRVVFQVKSGNVERGDVAKLNSDMQREHAQVGILITLKEPTVPMKSEAKKAGTYHHAFTGVTYDRIQIVTVREIIEDKKRLDMPLSAEILKTAQAAEDGSEQTAFALEVEGKTKKTKMVKATLPLPLGFKQAKTAKRSRRVR